MNRRHKTFLLITAMASAWSLLYCRNGWPRARQPTPKRAPQTPFSARKNWGRSEEERKVRRSQPLSARKDDKQSENREPSLERLPMPPLVGADNSGLKGGKIERMQRADEKKDRDEEINLEGRRGRERERGVENLYRVRTSCRCY